MLMASERVRCIVGLRVKSPSATARWKMKSISTQMSKWTGLVTCAVEDVVGVRPAHDHPQRKAKAFGDESGDDVAERAARHGQGHLRAHLQSRVLSRGGVRHTKMTVR